jgi:hypothetical protein
MNKEMNNTADKITKYGQLPVSSALEFQSFPNNKIPHVNAVK